MGMTKIVIAAVSGCLGSAFTGLSDALEMARAALARVLGDEAPFYVVTASAGGGAVVDGFGRTFPVSASIEEISACDVVLVPGFRPDESGRPPSLATHAAMAAWLRRQHARGALICAAGSGAFLLGEGGLLDGRRCTTSPRDVDELLRRYPRADAARGASLIEDRRVATAGAPFAWMDLVLHAIRTLFGEKAARIAAEHAAADAAAPDSETYRPNGYVTGLDPFLAEAERVVRQSGDAQLSTLDLARALSTSERTLHRRLKQAGGGSPKAFIDRVRIETARTMLETSGKSVKEISATAGFVDEASFRRAFRRFANMTPGAYRAVARARSHPKGHVFMAAKEVELIPEMLTRILDVCVNGVTLADPDQEDSPIVYANDAFERITGYQRDEILGQNCRFLQGDDREQEERARLKEAVERREEIEVTLRNYRKDGTLFHNRLRIAPLVDAEGRTLYLLGVQYDVTAQVRAELDIRALNEQLADLEPAK
jgi:PAS domain S-box-containing protein